MPDAAPRLFAAGSLRGALTAFAAEAGEPQPALVFGPAGLLRERIEGGDVPDAFLSANMAHPRALAAAAGGTVRAFAANTLVALARPGLGLTTAGFLDGLLRDGVRIGTSTPGLDPSGDYALELFDRAEAQRPGAGARLRARATALVGGREAPPPAAGPYPARGFLEAGVVDVFLTYRSNALTVGGGFDVVPPPSELAVRATYGLVVLAPVGPRREAAERLVGRLLSAAGIAVLERFGFEAPRP